MRFLAGYHGFAIAALLIGVPSSARAEVCALYADGTSDCYFSTRAQCMASVRSRHGSCIERGNAGAKPAEKPTTGANSPAKSKPAAR
jgi:hypothetical protein